MRILDVSPRVTLPLSSGSRIRMYNLLTRLSRNHEVRQFSQTSTTDLRRPGFEAEREVAASYREYRHRSWLGSPLCEIMERTRFGAPVLAGLALAASRPLQLRELAEWADLLVVEYPWQYGYCRSIAGRKPVVLATCSVQAAKTRPGGKLGLAGQICYAGTERVERRAVLGADLVLAVSSEDRDEFARHYGADPRRIVVVPNGADTALYRPAEEDTRQALRQRLGLPAGGTIIFPAPHRKIPTLEAMKWVRQTAALLPEVNFLITGAVVKQPVVEGNLHFTGFVEDYASYLRSADCMLCPMDRGGGTKIKLIESAAAGLAIVAFPESVRGTSFQHGEHLLVVDKTAQAIARAVRSLLSDRDEARRLGKAARLHALERYDWDLSAHIMETALSELVTKSLVSPTLD